MAAGESGRVAAVAAASCGPSRCAASSTCRAAYVRAWRRAAGPARAARPSKVARRAAAPGAAAARRSRVRARDRPARTSRPALLTRRGDAHRRQDGADTNPSDASSASPSAPDSSARECGRDRRRDRDALIRSASGGCVAYSRLIDFVPSPKSMWLICFCACVLRSAEPCGMPAIFFSAPTSPDVCRVNCTADASASHSRCRLTAAWISPAKNWPTKPRTSIAMAMTASGLPPLRSPRPPPNCRNRRPTRPSSRMPLSSPISRTFRRMSPLSTWLNSCPITPCNSSRLSRCSAPPVTVIAASAGE